MNVQATIMLSVLIGGLTFSGSLVAFGKLQELVTGRRPCRSRPEDRQRAHLRGRRVRAGGVSGHIGDANLPLYLALSVAALVIGVLFVMPIGGADMPVVISLLNSFSGLAAAMTGFVLGNNVLIIAARWSARPASS
jgi:H+-translocating NAD(P) transhydrogenase subunit beta